MAEELDFDELPPASAPEDDEDDFVNAAEDVEEEEEEPVPAVAIPAPVFIAAMPDPEEDNALTVFNAAWKIKLDEKRQVEFESEKLARATASNEISEFNKDRTTKLTARKESNRNGETLFVETVKSAELSPNIWDRVTKLIDAGGESGDSGKSDVGRMRKLFIQLKNEPLPTKA